MNNVSSFALVILTMAVLVVSASASFNRRATPAWNLPSGREFGTKRSAESPSRPSLIVEQEEINTDDVLAMMDGPSAAEAPPRKSARVLPSSARAAAVACVSAAAIGGARHAIELVGA
eukprot:CAMPEP_0196135132 /NCGR_PEP_ID=MMETSP0910-20130528/3872_1 /TAXON_ID=49265 /ORGANISM="Thalassiosira rotula, Strain GSO102" /LENGTH=117 /DNA_ID=CAMNT_0041395227 /DNA_START=221 /DNA_END=574 /DNA_ORIENTATION=+